MFKRKSKSELQHEGFTAADFNRTEEVKANVTLPNLPAPTVLDHLAEELKRVEELIHTRELEIKELNVRATELSTQISWLERTPQAVTILTALSKRYTGV